MSELDFLEMAKYIHDQKGKVFFGSVEESRIQEIANALETLYLFGKSGIMMKRGERNDLELDKKFLKTIGRR